MAHLTTFPQPDRLRVLAVDRISMSTQLLVEALARDAQFQMIESPSNAAAILELTKREKPHVAVISAKLGEDHAGGLSLLRELRTQSPSPRAIMLLDSSERAAVVAAFRAGAQGIFCRTEPFGLLTKCVQCVGAGQVWASGSELQFVLDALTQPPMAHFSGQGESPLSAREIDVVRCLSEGLTNREIGQRLKLTEHTVKNYLFRIFDKLGVSSRVEVVLCTLSGGLVHPPGASSTRGLLRPSASVRAKPLTPVAIRKTAR
jgi:two-component system, NarL family, nitrate/nitrite response regulator NarL